MSTDRFSTPMHIVYNCDDGYAVHTAVSITSLFENNSAEPDIRIYILGNGILQATKEKLYSIAADYNREGTRREIRIIDLQDFESALRLLFGEALDAGRFTVTALARIFAPQHLPDDVERYLYLDCDTVIRRPIRGLWETKLCGKIAGMTPEPTIYSEVRDYLGLSGDAPYFNTGMILVDRLRWEEEHITEACVEYYRSKNGRLPFSDQDILNYCLKERVLPLSPVWDFFTNYHYRSYAGLCREAVWYAAWISGDLYEEARKDPAIVHYAGDERPWLAGNFNPYRRDYESWLSRTPFAGKPKEGGHRLYLFLYHGMNLMTAVCPGLRKIISEHYYRTRMAGKAGTS